MDVSRQKILVVDDNEENRSLLKNVLGEEFELVEVDSVDKAIDILDERMTEFELVLIERDLKNQDGYAFLTKMNNNRWIDIMPVMIMSNEDSPYHVRRALGLGAVDYLARPFDNVIVRRRVENAVALYSRQRNMAEMLIQVIYQGEKNSNLLANILSHIVEFRNGQSSDHVLNVGLITNILLESMNRHYDAYNFTSEEITMISTAAELHDIGKITIPDSIAYKSGKLTNEEFEVMKSHSIAGECILDELTAFQSEPLIKLAKQVCRSHHERFDGNGYPDRLVGNQIPIAAQVVSVAEVYDVLTSERVYKDAVSSDHAINLIVSGECGQFNPDIVECLKIEAPRIIEELKLNPLSRTLDRDLHRIVEAHFSKDYLFLIDLLMYKYK